MFNSSLVVSLTTSFGARKHCRSHALRVPLLNAFGPSPLGPRLCPPGRRVHLGANYARDIQIVCACPPGRPDSVSGVLHAGSDALVGPGLKPNLVRKLAVG
jgi:hypothetical protein